LRGASQSVLSGLDVSWTGAGRSGTGLILSSSSNNTIEHVTASNRLDGIFFNGFSSGNTVRQNNVSASRTGIDAESTGQGNRYLGNDLTNAGEGWAMVIHHDRQFVVSANNFTGSAYGLLLVDMDGV